LNDTDSIPLLEGILSQLVKRVAFSTFGIKSSGYQGRLAVAHAMAKFGQSQMGDQIWKKYDRLDLNRKSEVPYILNALEDPQMTTRVLEILNREEDHQLMVGALNVLAAAGTPEAVPVLKKKVKEWEQKGKQAREENQQLMMGILNVLAAGGSQEAVQRVIKKDKGRVQGSNQTPDRTDRAKPILYYSVLEAKGRKAIYAIEERSS
jgi:hypothetical protein